MAKSSVHHSHGLKGVATTLCGLSMIGTVIPTMVQAQSVATAVVRTQDGPVQGFRTEGVAEFLGIPYAAPPIGNLRWTPPQAPAKWNGVLSATKFGNTCPQNSELGVFASPSSTEDCLYLNVFTPNVTNAQQAKRPVMVWIHGGGFYDGESNDYDGSKLATQGNTVVVTFNYRLGVLGFFAHPAIDGEAHYNSNYGLMDQQLVLDWVQKNIRAFGGDPANVTIFGESAGGAAVLANMISPFSSGLFQRGIAESGGYIAPPAQAKTLPQAEIVGQGFATAAGCGSQAASCLRQLSIDQILNVQAAYTIGPIIDGAILPRSFETALTTGAFNRVPLINGNNRDEWRWAVGFTEIATGSPVTAAGYPAALTSFYGAAKAPQVAAEYPLSSYASPSEALGAAETDSLMACTGQKVDQWVSRYVPVYAYEFADRTAPSYMAATSFPLGAAHTFEIQYLFPLYHGGQGTAHPLNLAQEQLSDDMVYYWTAFAAKANPNKSIAPFWKWPLYKTAFDNVQSLTLPNPVVTTGFTKEHHCDFWDSVTAY